MHCTTRAVAFLLALTCAAGTADARRTRRGGDDDEGHRTTRRAPVGPDWSTVVVSADPADVEGVLQRHGGKWLVSWREAHVLRPPNQRKREDWLAELATDVVIRDVQPNWTALHPACRQMSIDILEIVGRQDLRLQAALARLGGEDGLDAEGVIVALVDSGVAAIPELAGSLLPSVDVLLPGRDGRLRAMTRSSSSRAASRGSSGRDDPNGHGTALASLVQAFADGVQILPVRVVDSNCEGTVFDVALGIVVAAEQGASVINVSLGTPESSLVLAGAVAEAQALGALVVAAGGTGPDVESPASIAGVLAVTAVDGTDWPAAFAPTGPRIDLAAPGVDILGRGPDDLWLSLSGTSPAAALVSAAAAAIVKRTPDATVDERRALVRAAVRPAGEPAPEGLIGAGVLDLDAVAP